jgi:ribosomal protein L12E/L44/L45/RPP1/RPP2
MIGVKNLGQKNLDYMIKKIKAAEARIAKEEMAPLEASEKGQAVKSETVKERKNEKTINKDKV